MLKPFVLHIATLQVSLRSVTTSIHPLHTHIRKRPTLMPGMGCREGELMSFALDAAAAVQEGPCRLDVQLEEITTEV